MSWSLKQTNKLVLNFLDDNGKEALSEYNIANTETNPAGGAAATIANAAAALSQSALFSQEIRIYGVNTAPPAATSGPYDRPADKSAYRFASQDGSYVTLQIGAPQEAQFSDAWNVDPSNTDVIALITAMKTYGRTQEGIAIRGFLDGHRRRPPRRKGQ